VDAPPEGDQWLHEIKYDGYRLHTRLDRGAVKLLTRTGLDWTHKYPVIAKAVAALNARQAYLDGELCGVGPDGITSFSIVQLASDSVNAAALVFFLFVLLYLDGADFRPRPLIERKERLRALLLNAVPTPPGKQFEIRAEAYRRLEVALNENGITFADNTPRVALYQAALSDPIAAEPHRLEQHMAG
jgi:ATP-dependent DNA ligase